MRLSADLVKDIEQLSAFKKYEIETCQLQRVELSWLSNAERLVFFANVYNALMIHGIVKHFDRFQKPSEHSAFLHNAKYNIAGHCFSLLDVSLPY